MPRSAVDETRASAPTAFRTMTASASAKVGFAACLDASGVSHEGVFSRFVLFFVLSEEGGSEEDAGG